MKTSTKIYEVIAAPPSSSFREVTYVFPFTKKKPKKNQKKKAAQNGRIPEYNEPNEAYRHFVTY
jgi:hypothetical protein